MYCFISLSFISSGFRICGIVFVLVYNMAGFGLGGKLLLGVGNLILFDI